MVRTAFETRRKSVYRSITHENDTRKQHEERIELMRKFVEKFWPLPSPEKRRKGPIPRSWVFKTDKDYAIDADAQYLLYMLVNAVACIGYLFLVLLVVDIYFASGILIDPKAFVGDKLLLPQVLTHLVAWPALLTTLMFYLRIRLRLSIKNDAIPVFMHRALLIGYSKPRWLWRVSFGIAVGLVGIFAPHIFIIRFAQHFHQQENIWLILALEGFFGVLGPAYGGLIFVSYALIAEKVIRFFPEFEKELLTRNPLPRNY